MVVTPRAGVGLSLVAGALFLETWTMNQAPISKRERLLTAKEVAEWLGVSAKWVYAHATEREPRIPAKKLGGALRFQASEIDIWLDGLSGSNGTSGKVNR